jgi:hypothetical protein
MTQINVDFTAEQAFSGPLIVGKIRKHFYICRPLKTENAQVAKLVDALL